MDVKASYNNISESMLELKNYMHELNSAYEALQSDESLENLAKYILYLLPLLKILSDDEIHDISKLKSISETIRSATMDIIDSDPPSIPKTRIAKSRIKQHLQKTQINHNRLYQLLFKNTNSNLEVIISGVLEQAAEVGDQDLCDQIIFKLENLLKGASTGALLENSVVEHMLHMLSSNTKSAIDRTAIRSLISDLSNIKEFIFHREEMKKVSKSLDGARTYQPQRYVETLDPKSDNYIPHNQETIDTPPPVSPYNYIDTLDSEFELSENSNPTGVQKEIPDLKEPSQNFNSEPTRVLTGTVRRKPQKSDFKKKNCKTPTKHKLFNSTL